MKLIPKHQFGNIITRKGDPYQYKKSGNQYLYKKSGDTGWTTASGSRAQAIQGVFNKPTSANTVKPTTFVPFNKSAIGQYIDRTIKPVVNPASAMTWDLTNPTSQNNQNLMNANRTYHQEKAVADKNSAEKIQIQAKQDLLRNNGYKIKSDGVWGSASEGAYKDYMSKQPVRTVPKTELSVGAKIRDFGLRNTGYVGGGLVSQLADAMGVRDPITENALNDTDKRMIQELAKTRPIGTTRLTYGGAKGSGNNAIVNPYDYKPFEDEALNDSRRKIAAVYGDGIITKTANGVVINGGDYDYNQSSYIAPVIDKWNQGTTFMNKVLNAVQGFDRKYVAPIINTVDYDERPQIEQLDSSGRRTVDASGNFIMKTNPDLQKNIALNKTRKRGAPLEAVISMNKEGGHLIKNIHKFGFTYLLPKQL